MAALISKPEKQRSGAGQEGMRKSGSGCGQGIPDPLLLFRKTAGGGFLLSPDNQLFQTGIVNEEDADI